MALMLVGVGPERAEPQHSGGAHLCIPAGGLTGLALSVELSGTRQPDEACLADWAMRQNVVLSSYIAETPVIPVGIGSLFSSQTFIERHLREEAPTYRAMLERVADKVEYTVELSQPRAADPKERPTADANGLAYLTARRAARDRRLLRAVDRGGFASALRPKLSAVCSGLIERAARPGRIAAWGVLVTRDRVGALTQMLQAEGARATELGLSVKLIGPSPAFSFVTQDESRDVEPAL